MTSSDLADLFNGYGSDKDRNGYTSLYYILFQSLRFQPLTLLEVGIGTMIPNAPSSMLHYGLPGYAPGASLRAWRDFFPQGRIVGVDVQPDTQFQHEHRIETFLCDTTQASSVATFIQQFNNNNNIIFQINNNNIINNNILENNIINNIILENNNNNNHGTFDIIIDDGLHTDTAQLQTLTNLWPLLKEGGIYVIEDIYPHSRVSDNPNLVTAIVGNQVPIFYSGVRNNQCVIVKTYLNRQTVNF
jgi:hypothetical protein